MALVVLIKGLNVGGHRRFRPSGLAAQFPLLDMVNIGATGAFVVRRPVGRLELRRELARRLPFEAGIMICADRDILGLMSQDFFAYLPVRHDVVHFVSLLSRHPRRPPVLPVQFPAGGGRWVMKVLALQGRFALGIHRREMKAIGCFAELDRLFGTMVTTRSWSTIAAIAGALGWRPSE